MCCGIKSFADFKTCCTPCMIVLAFIVFLLTFMLGIFLIFNWPGTEKEMPKHHNIVPNRLPEFNTVGKYYIRKNSQLVA